MTAFHRIRIQTGTARRVLVSFSLILFTCSVIAASKGETESCKNFPYYQASAKS